MSDHVKTDPACDRYRPPRTRLGRWWFDVQRGKSCAPCRAVRLRWAARPVGEWARNPEDFR